MVFPRWANAIPGLIVGGLGAVGVGAVGIVWHYFTPEFWEVGYAPEQPVQFSHQLHAGTLGIDCRYCHTHVEEAAHSNVPDTATCMNCHQGAGEVAYLRSDLWAVHRENEHLIRVRSSYATGEPIRWRRIHKLPDYAHFNHAVHVNAGVSCYSCHGRMDLQEVARQEHSLSMGWCLECHRGPEAHVVDVDDPAIGRITNLQGVQRQLNNTAQQLREGAELVINRQLQPPQHCGACHY